MGHKMLWWGEAVKSKIEDKKRFNSARTLITISWAQTCLTWTFSFSLTLSAFPQLSPFFLIFLSFPQLSQFFLNFLIFPQLYQFFLKFFSLSSTFSVFLQISQFFLNSLCFSLFFLNFVDMSLFESSQVTQRFRTRSQRVVATVSLFVKSDV